MFEISGRKIGLNFPPYIVAEVSANHGGCLEKALETIKAASVNGASAVKIQTYTAETMTIDSDREDFLIQGGLWDGYKLFNLYKEAETPYEWHPELFSYAQRIGVTLFSTPFDETAVELLESLKAPAYKVASFELVDLPLIECIARTKKPMLISTGMASEHEIAEALETARINGCRDILLFHCISSYPAPLDQANLRMIQTLRQKFKVEVGLSDHTIGPIASIASVALGAVAIEKHFTLSRNAKGPDNAFSIEPHELKQLASDSHNTWKSIGHGGFKRPNIEAANRQFRRSLYFIRDLKAGDVVTQSDIARIRPGYGAPPSQMNYIVGKRLSEDVFRGTPVDLSLFSTP
jgi:N-acetylneuraminate synthase